MELERFSIRPFLPGEWPRFKAMRLQAMKENPGLFLSSYDDGIKQPDRYWIDTVTAKHGRVFGLFDADTLIGITGVFTSKHDPSSKTAHLVMSYIEPGCRGLGLSRLLYEARIDWARESGFEKCAVGHREGNDASKAANQTFGFVFVEKEEIDFSDGRAFDYRYELKL